MSTKTQSELSKFFGPVVATGAERICVRNLNNEFSCFKISKKIHSKETRREIKYFKFLKKRGISSSFIPSFISDFETKDEVIIEQELIADHPEQNLFAFRVEEFVADASDNQLTKLEKLFRELYTELKEKNIIISDLHAGNMMIYCDETGNIKRLIVVDGLGSPEAIPLAKYFRYFGGKRLTGNGQSSDGPSTLLGKEDEAENRQLISSTSDKTACNTI